MGWSERVNMCGRQIMVLPRKTKTYATHSGPGPHSGLPGPGILYRLPLNPPFVGTPAGRVQTGALVSRFYYRHVQNYCTFKSWSTEGGKD
jgi:hypothetical protein